MKKFRFVVLAAVVVGAIYAVVSMAAFTAFDEATGQNVVVIGPGDIIPNPDPCVCTMNIDPVACGTFPNRKVYSNACVAACDHATNCQEIELQF